MFTSGLVALASNLLARSAAALGTLRFSPVGCKAGIVLNGRLAGDDTGEKLFTPVWLSAGLLMGVLVLLENVSKGGSLFGGGDELGRVG